MNKVLSQYPAVLLFISLIHSYVLGFSIASSIAITALMILSGYRLYLDKIETPDPSAEIKSEIQKLNKQIADNYVEFKEMKSDFSKVSMSQRGLLNEQKIRF